MLNFDRLAEADPKVLTMAALMLAFDALKAINDFSPARTEALLDAAGEDLDQRTHDGVYPSLTAQYAYDIRVDVLREAMGRRILP